jgi:hypothetical protein
MDIKISEEICCSYNDVLDEAISATRHGRRAISASQTGQPQTQAALPQLKSRAPGVSVKEMRARIEEEREKLRERTDIRFSTQISTLTAQEAVLSGRVNIQKLLEEALPWVKKHHAKRYPNLHEDKATIARLTERLAPATLEAFSSNLTVDR